VGTSLQKNQYALLLESFALVNTHHPHTRLLLVGTGNWTLFIRKRARRLGIEPYVICVEKKEPFGYYHVMNCYVWPVEGSLIERSILEAIALGVPVIVTCGDQPHPIIESGKTGLVVPAFTVSGLAQGITLLLEDEQLRLYITKMGKSIFKQRFNHTRMVEEYKELFVEAQKKRREPAA
ncbi:MAG: glycosyltransferase family 4 protein, partial [Candidatus Babeliales bacterium]